MTELPQGMEYEGGQIGRKDMTEQNERKNMLSLPDRESRDRGRDRGVLQAKRQATDGVVDEGSMNWHESHETVCAG